MPADSSGVFIDATVFMGMHSDDQAIRRACKRFFAGRLTGGGVTMSWEQVGRCDDLVWGYSREVQDAYYPFMDVLHTEMTIVRTGYTEEDAGRAFTLPELAGLPSHERLVLGQVISHSGLLYTASPRLTRLTGRDGLPVAAVPAARDGEGEDTFPEHLEKLYQDSLVLTVASHTL
ncbi:DUF6190 family protein [Streptomyces sp. APSN-46.1]|uniref:DUF6190 family protein n=1 Tax=Streptomyces sp. APSN-46.1 TaxID=2929049 RepID=UPI001FB289BD|nr:DUF6190 family protein [Streptomyces sp. APSN-46.1]MCJ1681499.1 DUF6190 family protein [Streptomyces sp. APSN-46.1]